MILFFFILVLGCSNSPTGDPAKHACYTILDAETEDPVEGARVNMVTRTSDGGGMSHSGYTNSSGRCCFEYYTGSPHELYVDKEGYGGKWVMPVYSPVHIERFAILQLHVKNVPSQAPDDRLTVYYWSTYRFVESSYSFSGAIVDTTAFLSVHPAHDTLRWQSYADGFEWDSPRHDVSFTSGDTTFFEIIY